MTTHINTHGVKLYLEQITSVFPNLLEFVNIYTFSCSHLNDITYVYILRIEHCVGINSEHKQKQTCQTHNYKYTTYQTTKITLESK